MLPQTYKELLEMCKTPFNKQFPIDRDNLGPMLIGYVKQALLTIPKKHRKHLNSHSIGEPYLAQMIRDCLDFYRRNKMTLDPFYWSGEYSELICGRDFWKARNGVGRGEAFATLPGNHYGEILRRSAVGFGPCRLEVNLPKGEIKFAIPDEFISW